MSDEGTTPCAPDRVWICGACGRKSRTRYGYVLASPEDKRGTKTLPDGSPVSDPGWDEACMINAILCYADGPPWRADDEHYRRESEATLAVLRQKLAELEASRDSERPMGIGWELRIEQLKTDIARIERRLKE